MSDDKNKNSNKLLASIRKTKEGSDTAAFKTAKEKATPKKKPVTAAKKATPKKKPVTAAKKATPKKKPVTAAKKTTPKKKPATAAKKAAPNKKPATSIKKVSNSTTTGFQFNENPYPDGSQVWPD